MNTRNKMAVTCQGGASNERRVAMALVEAIDECRAENVNPREDAACFLILHQLAFLMTGFDMALGIDRLADRWAAAMKEVEAP
jgi:hypothetical protein